ncbi:hypothetical protein CGRA01v4_03572 [Colletotrichum graminicola]|nr:hypothetical protein CGRA01v4_03572 [Colletotrichum graminicola]
MAFPKCRRPCPYSLQAADTAFRLSCFRAWLPTSRFQSASRKPWQFQ